MRIDSDVMSDKAIEAGHVVAASMRVKIYLLDFFEVTGSYPRMPINASKGVYGRKTGDLEP